MKIVWSWLAEYVDLGGVAVADLAQRWTLAGLEVGGIERIGDWWDPQRLLVGAVVRVEPHPNADRLVLADIDLGPHGAHRVVTGAPNLLHLRDVGDLPNPMKVAFAREGAELFDGHAEGQVKTILKGRLVRGVMSDAMVCSEKELGLSADHEGILILDDATPLGIPLIDALGETVIDIDILPNFARAMNVIGVARETAVLLGRKFEDPLTPLVEAPGEPASALASVAIDDPDLCPRYSARVIRGLSVAPSPARMARRLSLSGMRPINNVVDITNYVMLEWGEPLHAFDYDKLVARAGGATPQIRVRRARAGERITTLDTVDRALDGETLLITDAAGPLAIAGVMGGSETEVGADTTSVLLEAASFDFINVRRTSREQRISSESAARFGRGVAPALVAPASARAAELLRTLAAGAVAPGLVDAFPRPYIPPPISFPFAEVQRVLGVALPEREVTDVLERLEFAVDHSGGALRVRAPDHRLDVTLPADVIEEVARIHGYDRLPTTTLSDPLPPQRNNPRLAAHEAARNALASAGLQEIVSYRLVAPEVDDATLAVPVPGGRDHVVLANPISPERSVLRRSILTGLLEAARANRRYRDRLALFELGPVFHPAGTDLPAEPWHIGLVLAGPERAATWRSNDAETMDVFHAKGCAERLLAGLGQVAHWRPAPGAHPSMHPGRTAALSVGAQEIGHVGELHPAVALAWDLAGIVAVADLDLDALVDGWGASAPFAPFSSYPPVKEDLAVVVDAGVEAVEVLQAIRDGGGDLVANAALFDVFEGPQLGAGKKSLAWAVTYQSADHTLSGEEVAAVRARIVKELEVRLGARLRS